MARPSGVDSSSSTSHAVVELGLLVSYKTASYAWLQCSREVIQEGILPARALADNASTTRRDSYETTSRGPI